jgi:hypothetical protein
VRHENGQGISQEHKVEVRAQATRENSASYKSKVMPSGLLPKEAVQRELVRQNGQVCHFGNISLIIITVTITIYVLLPRH